jgi:hypothetical protein
LFCLGEHRVTEITFSFTKHTVLARNELACGFSFADSDLPLNTMEIEIKGESTKRAHVHGGAGGDDEKTSGAKHPKKE